VVNEAVYLASGDAGLEVIGIADPAHPVLLARLETSGSAYDLWVQDSYAYIANDSAGLQIVDVSDPLNPKQVGSRSIAGSARSIQIAGKFGYVAGDLGLQVIDLTDPASPQTVRPYGVSSLTQHVEVTDNLAYLANDRGGLEVIDISNPKDLVRVGGYNDSGLTRGVQVVSNLVYLAEGEQGVRILERRVGVPQVLEFSLPAGVALSDSPLTLKAAASSGLPVSFSVTKGKATVKENQLLFSAPGQVTVRAEQLGDAQFLPILAERELTVVTSFPPRFDAATLSFSGSGEFRFQVKGDPNQTLFLESSIDLRSWTVVSIATVEQNSAEFKVSPPVVFGRGFYRIRVE
jgi:hypothetical protein